MKLTNKTRWRTDDLRALIAAACRWRGVPSRGLVVTVVVSRKRYWAERAPITGYATIGYMNAVTKRMRYGRTLHLRLPADATGRESIVVDVAQVIEHEIAHLAGYHHPGGKDNAGKPIMSEALYNCTQPVADWLGDLQLRLEAVEAADETQAKAAAAGTRAACSSGR